MLFFDLFRHDPQFVEINAGETLFKEGDAGDTMYVLIAGEAEITISGILFEKCTQGSFVGEMAVIDGSPRYATVTAATDCKFVIVGKKHFRFLVDETPGFAIEVMRVMAARLKQCGLRVIQANAQHTA
ncbi:MAG: cyclic nucleotide-binding domain-containing protein [Gallionella sp.]|nr:cyclic nucleotide-binding domain-containing protein [Gallionella sp.]